MVADFMIWYLLVHVAFVGQVVGAFSSMPRHSSQGPSWGARVQLLREGMQGLRLRGTSRSIVNLSSVTVSNPSMSGRHKSSLPGEVVPTPCVAGFGLVFNTCIMCCFPSRLVSAQCSTARRGLSLSLDMRPLVSRVGACAIQRLQGEWLVLICRLLRCHYVSRAGACKIEHLHGYTRG